MVAKFHPGQPETSLIELPHPTCHIQLLGSHHNLSEEDPFLDTIRLVMEQQPDCVALELCNERLSKDKLADLQSWFQYVDNMRPDNIKPAYTDTDIALRKLASMETLPEVILMDLPLSLTRWNLWQATPPAVLQECLHDIPDQQAHVNKIYSAFSNSDVPEATALLERFMEIENIIEERKFIKPVYPWDAVGRSIAWHRDLNDKLDSVRYRYDSYKSVEHAEKFYSPDERLAVLCETQAIHARNDYMVHRLAQQAEKCDSIVAMVGMIHLPGIQHVWSEQSKPDTNKRLAKIDTSGDTYMKAYPPPDKEWMSLFKKVAKQQLRPADIEARLQAYLLLIEKLKTMENPSHFGIIPFDWFEKDN